MSFDSTSFMIGVTVVSWFFLSTYTAYLFINRAIDNKLAKEEECLYSHMVEEGRKKKGER